MALSPQQFEERESKCRRFLRYARTLGVLNLLVGIIAAFVQARNPRTWPLLLGFIAMGIPVGFSLLLYVSIFVRRAEFVRKEKWFLFRFIFFVLVVFSFFLPTMPIAIVTFFSLRKWLESEIPDAEDD